MSEIVKVPDINRVFTGVSDVDAVRTEVIDQHSRLVVLNAQLALERELAADICHARSMAILGSSALRLVYAADETETVTARSTTASDLLSSAFLTKVDTGTLPDGFAKALSKNMRTRLHPDVGGDDQLAKEAGQKLDDVNYDPVFSVVGTVTSVFDPNISDLQTLRDERYRNSLLLDNAVTNFTSEAAAREASETEIDGAEWRVRVQAAMMCLELVTGGDQTWSEFLHEIVRQRHMSLIGMVNKLQPRIMAVQERIIKGRPIDTDNLDIERIDSAIELIWSTLSESKDGASTYNPPYPYQNWLEILLPVLEALDPGKVSGEEYTDFSPPIFVVQKRQQPQAYGGNTSRTYDKLRSISQKQQYSTNNKDYYRY